MALIGPDGAGKTAVARRLPSRLRQPVAYVYMGVAHKSASHLLPTTRLRLTAMRRWAGGAVSEGTLDRAAVRVPKRGATLAKRVRRGLLSTLKLGNRLAEEWYRQAVVWRYRRQGRVVILDRHFLLDFYSSDVADPGRSVRRRAHGWVLDTFYPRPDLVIYLDAAAEVLFARKGEGTLESLERMRSEYAGLGGVVPHFEIVDAARPLDDVVEDVATRIEARLRAE